MAIEAQNTPTQVPGTPAPINGNFDPTGTTGTNDPQINMYADYRKVVNGTMDGTAQAYTTTQRTDALTQSLNQNVYDPWGPVSRPVNGRQYNGPWVNPYDTATYAGDQYRADNGLFKYNQMLMTVAQNFDPFMQKKEAMRPHWWLNRVPRTAYKLFDGTVHETRIYRGGLSVYSGLSDWEDLAPDPTKADACASLPFKTYSYAWEARAWSGKKTAWGSDPICLDIFKFTPHAIEQLGWILETGVKFGTDIQNIWNRDMFIYHSVMAGRSYVMTSQYRGAGSPRYVYEPYCRFVDDADPKAGTAMYAKKSFVSRPFVLVDATANVEPLNFDVLDIFRRQLERQCPEAAIGKIGTNSLYALAVSEEDVEKYIRGNEEERKYWIEANPQALINHYGFATSTFRRWSITCDGDQLRFKYKRYIPEYTQAEAANYGFVGLKELAGKPVYVAEAVDPEIAGRAGINGSPIPEPNPEYDMAELAIAPVFMDNVFTNQFVPDVTTLGHSTYFGPKKGLNGKWAWYNIQTEKNPDMKIGNFKGEFEIVPKPENCAMYASSFLYRRCVEPLPSLCPAENPKINVRAKASTTVSGAATAKDPITGLVTATVDFTDALLGASAGEQLRVAGAKEMKTVTTYTYNAAAYAAFTGIDTLEKFNAWVDTQVGLGNVTVSKAAPVATATVLTVAMDVFESITGTKKNVQLDVTGLTADTFPTSLTPIAEGSETGTATADTFEADVVGATVTVA